MERRLLGRLFLGILAQSERRLFFMSYLMLIVLTTLIGLAAQSYVNRQIKKYSKVYCSLGVSGTQAGQMMLSANGVGGVPFIKGGSGQDHFDPRNNSITLDPHAYSQASVTAVATACHEVGHACQYAAGYAPMKIRGALVPVVNFASKSWMIVLIAGIFLNLMGLIDVAIALYLFAVIFQLVTLPVEFNASARALKYLKSLNIPQAEQDGAASVLRACALTYVAAALMSILQLLWLLNMRD